MTDIINVGLIVKPQGVRGEVKVMPLTDDINRFKNLKSVIIDGASYRIQSVKIGCDAVFVLLENISDRNSAETLRGKYMSVERKQAVSLPENSYFIVDILGCEVYTENAVIGKVIDVFSSKTDVFTVKCNDGRVMRFPFLKDAITCVDVVGKKITLKEKRLKEICCYED